MTGRGEEDDGTLRAFVALDLDAVSLKRVAHLSQCLQATKTAPRATWTPPEKMHVTLAFAGALRSDLVDALARALQPVAKSVLIPTAHRSWLDAFPSTTKAGVVVLRLQDESGVLATLAKKITDLPSLRTVGKADRPFRPHVTLARLRRASDVRQWLRTRPDASGGCRMTALTLYRSDLGAGGSTYVALERFALREG
jgi:2'-5' RNA ligase